MFPPGRICALGNTIMSCDKYCWEHFVYLHLTSTRQVSTSHYWTWTMKWENMWMLSERFNQGLFCCLNRITVHEMAISLVHTCDVHSAERAEEANWLNLTQQLWLNMLQVDIEWMWYDINLICGMCKSNPSTNVKLKTWDLNSTLGFSCKSYTIARTSKVQAALSRQNYMCKYIALKDICQTQ